MRIKISTQSQGQSLEGNIRERNFNVQIMLLIKYSELPDYIVFSDKYFCGIAQFHC